MSHEDSIARRALSRCIPLGLIGDWSFLSGLSDGDVRTERHVIGGNRTDVVVKCVLVVVGVRPGVNFRRVLGVEPIGCGHRRQCHSGLVQSGTLVGQLWSVRLIGGRRGCQRCGRCSVHIDVQIVSVDVRLADRVIPSVQLGLLFADLNQTVVFSTDAHIPCLRHRQ